MICDSCIYYRNPNCLMGYLPYNYIKVAQFLYEEKQICEHYKEFEYCKEYKQENNFDKYT